MKTIDYHSDLNMMHKYIMSFYPDMMRQVGIFDVPTFHITNEYEEWKNAVFQALHLRYAERHHFYPWERFMTIDTTRAIEWPKPEEIEILSADFQFEWSQWLWADNFLTLDQEKALQQKTSPYDYPPFRSDILPWDTLIYLLKTLEFRRERGEGDLTLIDSKLFDDDALEQFGLFVWHLRRNGSDSRYSDPIYKLQWFLSNRLGLNTESSYKTWHQAISFLLHNMYQTIMLSSSKDDELRVVCRKVAEK